MFGYLTVLWGLLILKPEPASAFIRDGRNVYATVGETVSFPCALARRPARPITSPYGSWTWQPKGGQSSAIISFHGSGNPAKAQNPTGDRTRMEGDHYFGDFALSLIQVQKADEGIFACNFERGQATGSYRLRLLQVTSNVRGPFLDNEVVSLTLSPQLGSVRWKGPGGAEKTGSQLEIRPPLKLGPQTWVCNVTHAGDSLDIKYSFEVIGFTQQFPERLYLKPHEAVNLRCVLSSLPPNLAEGDGLIWMRDGSPILRLSTSGLSAQQREVGLPLRLRAEEVANSSALECRLSLGARSISRVVRVCVISVTSNHSGSIAEFDEASMTCAVSPSCSDTRLTWVRGNGSRGNGLETQTKGSVTRSLARVDRYQAGLWLCQLYDGDTLVKNETFWLNVRVAVVGLSMKNLFVMVGLAAGSLLLLVFLLLLVVCMVKRSRRRRRAVRRLRHPLCREHGNQLSNQPLCQGNDYIDSNRPLPPPPYRRCPHNPPRKGRSSRGNSRRAPSQAIYVT